MIPVSWKRVKSWNCFGCGKCCRDYHVVLNLREWMDIVRNYGVNCTIHSVGKLLLGKRSDGFCCFLTSTGESCFCGLQNMKPLACKIWPFKIYGYPKFGNSNEASFRYLDRNFFIYADPECTGLCWGKPTPKFKFKTIPEFIDVIIGHRKKQIYSTSNLQFRTRNNLYRPRNLI